MRARSRGRVLPSEQVVDRHARELRDADRHAAADDAPADDVAERDVLGAQRLRDRRPSAAPRTKEEQPGFRCERCGHEWVARRPRNLPPGKTGKREKLPKPRLCPHCKSAWWDTPKA